MIALRKEHRIVGNLVGCPPRAPRQVAFSGLPLILQPEEVTVLLREGVIETLTSLNLTAIAAGEKNRRRRRQFKRFREESYRSQVEVCRDDRAERIRQMADTILEGKRRKQLNSAKSTTQVSSDVIEIDSHSPETEQADVVVDKEVIINEQLERIQDFPPQNLLIQTFHGERF